VPRAIDATVPPLRPRATAWADATPQPAAKLEADSVSLSGALLGGLAGSVTATSAARAAAGLVRVNPAWAMLAGIALGAIGGAAAFTRLKETAVGRHSMAATLGAMGVGGAAAIGALTLGATSGVVVAAAAGVGAVAGLVILARLADAVLG
jgi:hypothetical protein